MHLDGTGTSDPDSDEDYADVVSFRWLREESAGTWASLGEGESLDVELPLGSHALRLEVKDRAGATSHADTHVAVVDTLPPEISVTANPAELTPPNRRMVEVALDVTTRDQCSGVEVRLISATSNAPPQPGAGVSRVAPPIPPDIEDASIGSDDRAVRLRAEHNQDDTQRIYTLRYSATDGAGNQSEAEANVRVVEPSLWRWLRGLLAWLASLFGF